jgi:HlyD family secretion protein
VVIDLPLQDGDPILERSNYSEGTTIALIAETDSFIFRSKLIENDILKLKLKDIIYVIPFAYDSLYIEATVSKISTKGKLHDGITKYEFEAHFKIDKKLHLYSGFNATAEVLLGKSEHVLSVPEKYLIFKDDSVFVEVLRGNTFVPVRIFTGISDGENIEVLSGINENDRIKIQN